MAERVGFEPTIPVKVCPLSRRIVSTTHAPLRKAASRRQASAKQIPRYARNDTVLDLASERLTTVSKERLQHFRAATGQHSAANLHLMIQLRMVQDCHHRTHCASFGIVRAVHQAPDASMHHRAGAHGARLNCNKELTVFQTVVINGCSGFAQGDDFRGGGGGRAGGVAVPSAPNNPSVAHYHGSYRNLS